MSHPRHYIHEDAGEEDLWIDLSILTFLREEMLSGNLDYISLREPHKQGIFSSDVDCSWERFRRRALYQVGLGFAEPRIIYGPEGERIDTKKHTGYLCSLRITPFGFMQIGELEKELKKYEGFNRYITKVKIWSDKVIAMKGGFVIGFTAFLVICIFTFDIKVSEMVQKIPIISSIIDTTILEKFEAINEKDEFYRALMADSIPLSGSGIDASSSKANDPIQTSSKEVLSQSEGKEIIIPKIIQKVLPENVKVLNMTVRNISNIEKQYRLVLDNGTIQFVQIKKNENGKYIIVGK